MGHDARAKAERDLIDCLLTLLQTKGYIESHEDLENALHFLEALAPILLNRDLGYCALLEAILEGDFTLESDRHLEGLIKTTGNSLFLPRYSMDKVTGSIEIEEALYKDGYIIRRKT